MHNWIGVVSNQRAKGAIHDNFGSFQAYSKAAHELTYIQEGPVHVDGISLEMELHLIKLNFLYLANCLRQQMQRFHVAALRKISVGV